MQCENCRGLKLAEEYPETITPNCEHQICWCFTCVLNFLDLNLKSSQTSKCIDPTCPNQVDRFVLETLQSEYPFQFYVHHHVPKEEPKLFSKPSPVLAGQPMSIYVTALDGRRNKYNVSSKLPIWTLKGMIAETLRVKPEYQRLIYNKQPLKKFIATEADQATLSSYGIREGAEIHLLIMMYELKEEDRLKEVEFDLSWGYPGKRDYLDGSCLTFNQGKHIETIDYKNTRDVVGAIKHWEIMDDSAKKGTHRITVSLEKLTIADMLFFILSSYSASSIKDFPSLSVRIFESNSPKDALSTYELTDESSESSDQALVMCCLVKGPKGRWYIYQVGKQSKGNTKRYAEIIKTITTFIEGDLAKSRTGNDDE